LEIWRL